MKNYIQPGNTIDWVVTGAAVVSGQTIVIGTSIVGVAVTDGAVGDTIAVTVEGVFEVAKATAAIGLGVAVYWDADGDPVGGTAGSGAATATDTANTLMGKAIEAAAGGTATVKVKLG